MGKYLDGEALLALREYIAAQIAASGGGGGGGSGICAHYLNVKFTHNSQAINFTATLFNSDSTEINTGALLVEALNDLEIFYSPSQEEGNSIIATGYNEEYSKQIVGIAAEEGEPNNLVLVSEPYAYSYDVTDVASLSITDIVVGSGSGGPQPTLFPPVITQGINTVSWIKNTRNGDFGSSTVGTIDDNVVTSPLSITQAMDGKTLVVKTEDSNFNDGISSTELKYFAPSGAGGTIAIYSLDNDKAANYPYPCVKISPSYLAAGKVLVSYNGQELGAYNNSNYNIYIPLPNTVGTHTLSVNLQITEDIILTGSNNISMYLAVTRGEGEVTAGIRQNPYPSDSYDRVIGTGYGSLSSFINGILNMTSTYDWTQSSSISIKVLQTQELHVGDIITFNIEVNQF